MASSDKRSSKPSHPEGDRLQKVLASAGVGSRRECEQLILEGRIEVDDDVVTVLGTRVDPDKHDIFVDGEKITVSARVYIALNKPRGIVCTNNDPERRPRAIDLVPIDARLFPVGRLDRTSEGLLIMTNDGEFANRIAHPRFGLEKVYLARVSGCPTAEDLKKLTNGVHLAEGFAKATRAKVRKKFRDGAEVEIVLDEGRNREVRRLLASIDHKVLNLQRVAIGPLMLGSMLPGQWRRLTAEELSSLRKATRSSAPKKRPAPRRKWNPAKKKKKSARRGSERNARPPKKRRR